MFSDLVELGLDRLSSITYAGLSFLRGAVRLQHLDLSFCYPLVYEFQEPHHMRDVIMMVPQLRQLTLDGFHGIAKLPKRKKKKKKEQRLQPRRTIWGGDAALAGLTQQPPALTHLNLSWCWHITDAGLAHLRKIPTLTHLDLTLCRLITDAGLAHLQHLPALTFLRLGWCEEITDAGLAYLRNLPLTFLDLYQCKHITEAGLAHLEGLPLNTLITEGTKIDT